MNAGNSFNSFNNEELMNLSKFVVTENFKHHTEGKFPNEYNDDIASVYKEEMDYLKNSKIFAVKTGSGEIKGTIRLIKWDFITPLPIQKMFGINPLTCNNGRAVNEIFHIGRFAITKGSQGALKKLILCAIKPICEHKDNIAYAECDAKLLRILKIMGIEANVIGKSINYLGSETIPVSIPYEGVIDFYNKHNEELMIFSNVSA